jgi:hypothetical protein
MENIVKWNKLKPKYQDNKSNKKLPKIYDFYKSEDFKNVYEPSDDTFLILDVLDLEINDLLSKNIKFSAEVGYNQYFKISKVVGMD